jgi:hypothetical protein
MGRRLGPALASFLVALATTEGWLAADVEATLPGDFVAAGWMSAS